MPGDRLRTFIAIALPTEIKNWLAKIQQALKAAGADVKWVEPENIHITIKFLGERDKKKIAEIIEAIDQVCAEIPTFELTISSLGGFPSKESARIIWVGLSKGETETKEIAKRLEEEISRTGIPKETRPFSSHITLGRVRSSLNRQRLLERMNYLEGNFPRQDFQYRAEKITLFKSTLSSRGPVYEALYLGSLKTT